MVNLTIDGRGVCVEEGTTVLEAAHRLGIRIPTLCYVENFPAAASCYLCGSKLRAGRRCSPPAPCRRRKG